jgi:hypothetical protein
VGGLGAVVVGLVSAWALSLPPGYRVQTPRGVKSVRIGMPAAEVGSVLGKPFAVAESRGDAQCFRYGYPSMDPRGFPIYSACYQEAKLSELRESWFRVTSVGPDGFSPSEPQ